MQQLPPVTSMPPAISMATPAVKNESSPAPEVKTEKKKKKKKVSNVMLLTI